jgi:NAD(P)-dependent dehydrogenase (short-subunit alcohol dehydrogenase family)
MALGYPPRVAVFGARSGSLGAAVATRLRAQGVSVRTYGIGDEDVPISYNFMTLDAEMADYMPSDVLVTTGMNRPRKIDAADFEAVFNETMNANVTLPLRVLRAAIENVTADVRSVAFISSNSAHIARTESAAYCASKAALSMAIRVAAREQAGRGPIVYGYEPGLLDGTPMTEKSAASFGGALHRIPGLPPREGLDVEWFAEYVAANLIHPSMALNGTLMRLDGGEQ